MQECNSSLFRTAFVLVCGDALISLDSVTMSIFDSGSINGSQHSLALEELPHCHRRGNERGDPLSVRRSRGRKFLGEGNIEDAPPACFVIWPFPQ
jgi:hypothetical protein